MLIAVVATYLSVRGRMAAKTKLSDGLGGGGRAHGALTNSRDARTDSGEAVRGSAMVSLPVCHESSQSDRDNATMPDNHREVNAPTPQQNDTPPKAA